MLQGVGDVDFVVKSIEDINNAANSDAREIVSVERRAEKLDWAGDDRRRFDEKRVAFLDELRTMELTLRAKAAELEDILRDQSRASGV